MEIAPQFVAAWNNLGTIAYQSRDYATAEKHFRRALSEDPAAYEPLVNLGGALLTLMKADEALPVQPLRRAQPPQRRPGQRAARHDLLRPREASTWPRSTSSLARQLDPGHFSHPQLTLAEVYLRRKQYGRAAGELEDFLRRHPDWPGAAKMREAIAGLRAREK